MLAEIFGELADPLITRKERTLLEIVTDLGMCASVSIGGGNGRDYNFCKYWLILLYL